MKYECTLTIRQPRDRVVELFTDPTNLAAWVPTLVDYEPLEGQPGEEGARARMSFQMGKKRVDMTETVTRQELPDLIEMTYEAQGVYNEVLNRFEETDDGDTVWTTENLFQFSGYMKVFGWLMPGAFRKQTLKHMQDFKEFAESGTSASA